MSFPQQIAAPHKLLCGRYRRRLSHCTAPTNSPSSLQSRLAPKHHHRTPSRLVHTELKRCGIEQLQAFTQAPRASDSHISPTVTSRYPCEILPIAPASVLGMHSSPTLPSSIWLADICNLTARKNDTRCIGSSAWSRCGTFCDQTPSNLNANKPQLKSNFYNALF